MSKKKKKEEVNKGEEKLKIKTQVYVACFSKTATTTAKKEVKFICSIFEKHSFFFFFVCVCVYVCVFMSEKCCLSTGLVQNSNKTT